jgi:hypothetical protein
MGVDPIAFMLEIIRDGVAEQTILENGKKRKTTVTASLEMRADLAKHVSRFLAPQLSSTAVTGPDESPIQTTTVNMVALLDSPEAVELAQKLALMGAVPDNPVPAIEATAVEARPVEPQRLPCTL